MSSENRQWIPRPGDVLDSRYVLGDVLDEGAMGVVMRSEHRRMGRTVAIKLLHPHIAQQTGYRERFEREVRLATLLDHPNVVRCYDYGETDAGVLYLVMELLEGENLKQQLHRCARVSTDRVFEVGIQLLDGMAAAHAHEVIHRDLKPGNLFLVKDYQGRDQVKILDFGMAKSLVDESVKLTKTGTVLGTPAYLPPESLIQQRSGKPGDVYSMALILLEMLLGQKVFSGSSISETFVQQLLAPARIPRRIWDTPLGEMLARALRKDPERRTRDGREMLEQLTAAKPAVSNFTLKADEVPSLVREIRDKGVLAELMGGQNPAGAFARLPDPEPFESMERSAAGSAHRGSAAEEGEGEPTLRTDDQASDISAARTMQDDKPTVQLPRPAAPPAAEASRPSQDEAPAYLPARTVAEVPTLVDTEGVVRSKWMLGVIPIGSLVVFGLFYAAFEPRSEQVPPAATSAIAQPKPTAPESVAPLAPPAPKQTVPDLGPADDAMTVDEVKPQEAPPPAEGEENSQPKEQAQRAPENEQEGAAKIEEDPGTPPSRKTTKRQRNTADTVEAQRKKDYKRFLLK